MIIVSALDDLKKKLLFHYVNLTALIVRIIVKIMLKLPARYSIYFVPQCITSKWSSKQRLKTAMYS